jgi:hypothetical protein
MRLAGALAALALLGCSSSESLPGKSVIGTYAFTATQVGGDCAFVEQPDGGFAYAATLSFDPGTTHGYLTLVDNEISRDAGFDGAVLDAPASGQRVFAQCACDDHVTVKERIVVALLSESQRQAVDGGCPSAPLDGGVPAPDDAGISAPGPRGDTYDAPLACGFQTEEIVPGEDCTCEPCSLRYSLSGVKQ